MRRKLGQHFLRDEDVVARILATADIQTNDYILEIGPGQGILTVPLARQAKWLLAIEHDPALAKSLQQRFAGQEHVRILHDDARHINYQMLVSEELSLKQRVKVVANLPYYAATPILLALFQHSKLFEQCIFMFQKEVAERLTASPGTKAYGALSVVTQYYSEPHYCFSVAPMAFRPPPRVESAVVILRFFEHPRVDVADQDYFFQLVRYAFMTRRKTLKNALVKSGSDLCSLEQLYDAYNELGFHERIRGEELSIEEFARLCNVLIRLRHA